MKRKDPKSYLGNSRYYMLHAVQIGRSSLETPYKIVSLALTSKKKKKRIVQCAHRLGQHGLHETITV